MSRDCLVCRAVSGEVQLPGGLLLDEDDVVAYHHFPVEETLVYLGWLMVVTRRDAPGFEDLTEREASGVGVAVARLARVLRDAAGADHVFVARVGTGVPHLHVHLLPRYPETPRDVPWHAVGEWEGARRGSFEDAATLIAALRDDLQAGARLAGP